MTNFKGTLKDEGRFTVNKRKGLILFVVISGMLILSACGGLDQSIWAPDPIEAPASKPSGEVALANDFAWTPGTYTGIGVGGFGGDIYVEVVVHENGQITSITITDHSETASFMEMVEMQLIPEIISAQATGVDAVVGATLSSKALIMAVEEALSLAIIEAAPSEVAPPTTTGTSWPPGTYTGVGVGGFGGDIYVEVVIDGNGQIASITVTDHSETASFMEMVKMQVIPGIISTQSTEIDTVVGATLSSEALIQGVKDALSGIQ